MGDGRWVVCTVQTPSTGCFVSPALSRHCSGGQQHYVSRHCSPHAAQDTAAVLWHAGSCSLLLSLPTAPCMPQCCALCPVQGDTPYTVAQYALHRTRITRATRLPRVVGVARECVRVFVLKTRDCIETSCKFNTPRCLGSSALEHEHDLSMTTLYLGVKCSRASRGEGPTQ